MLHSEFDQDYSRKATFEENLTFFRTMLRSLSSNLKKVRCCFFTVVCMHVRFSASAGTSRLRRSCIHNSMLFDVPATIKLQCSIVQMYML